MTLAALSDDELIAIHFSRGSPATEAELRRRIRALRTTQPAPMAAGEALAIRRALGLTQIDIAALCGVTRRTWRSWETGYHPVPPEAARLLRLCQAAGAQAIPAATTTTTAEDILTDA